jgi:hypothetical protein
MFKTIMEQSILTAIQTIYLAIERIPIVSHAIVLCNADLGKKCLIFTQV